MRATLGLLVGFATFGCGGTGTDPANTECRDLQVLPVDEARSCLAAAPANPGIRVCLDADKLRGLGLFPVCLADQTGAIYRAYVTSSEWIVGAGWTHSEIPHAASTLSAEVQRRCDMAPAASFKPTCPAQ